MSPEAREQLRHIILNRGFHFGEFTLHSSKTSNYYIDCKRFLFYSEAAALLGEAVYAETYFMGADALGGPEIGALPLTSAAVVEYHRRGQRMEGFFVRKEAKDHGAKKEVEGVDMDGRRVVILDDVLTTGNSARAAAEKVTQAGGHVVGVVCLIDRKEGAKELLQPRYNYRSIFDIDDFLKDPGGANVMRASA